MRGIHRRRFRAPHRCAASRRASVRANDDVDLARAGEILGLLGENGAGKTTLMNILFGAYAADAGTIAGRRPAGRASAARPTRWPPASAWCTSISSSPRASPCWRTCWSACPGDGGRLDRAGGLARLDEIGRDYRPALDPDRPVGDAVGRRAAAAGDRQGAVSRRAHPDPRRADRGADAGRGRRPVRGAARDGGAGPRHHLHLAQAQRGAGAHPSLRGAAPRPRRRPRRRPGRHHRRPRWRG